MVAIFRHLQYFLVLVMHSMFCWASPAKLPSPLNLDYQIVLPVGGKESLKASSITSIWVGHGDIIRVRPLGALLEVKALNVGFTDMRVGSQPYKVQVLTASDFELFQRFKKIIPSTLGLNLAVEEGQLRVVGRLYSLDDLYRLQQVFISMGRFEMRASLGEILQEQLQIKINNLLKQSRQAAQNILFADRWEVMVKDKNPNILNITKIVAPFGITVIQEEKSVDIEPLIKVEITVAEVSREFSQKYGIEWPNQLPGVVSSKKLIFENPQQLIAKFLETSGKGKVLASPNLLCRSGKEAEFLAGGEFPIKVVSNRKFTEVQWKKYGVLLKIKPLADRTGRMSIAIETEVSTIDAGKMIDGVPGLLTNRMTSHFDLNKPRTITLSGLIKNNEGSSSQGLPGLSQIPILGPLFSSKDFLNSRTELVVLVHPSIVNESQEQDLIEKVVTPRHLGDF